VPDTITEFYLDLLNEPVPAHIRSVSTEVLQHVVGTDGEFAVDGHPSVWRWKNEIQMLHHGIRVGLSPTPPGLPTTRKVRRRLHGEPRFSEDLQVVNAQDHPTANVPVDARPLNSARDPAMFRGLTIGIESLFIDDAIWAGSGTDAPTGSDESHFPESLSSLKPGQRAVLDEPGLQVHPHGVSVPAPRPQERAQFDKTARSAA
jgi:hypothetical protein